MLEKEFKEWLEKQTKDHTGTLLSKKVISNHLSDIRRVFKVYDLHDEYKKDKCKSIIALFDYSKDDERVSAKPKCDISIKGSVYKVLKALKGSIVKYQMFLNYCVSTGVTF